MMIRMLEWLRSERGGVADFVLGATLMAFFSFFPIEFSVPLQRMWVLQHVKAQMLEKIMWEGQIPADVMDRLQGALAQYPFMDPAKVQVGPATTTPGVPAQFGDPIVLQIGYPQGRLLTARLIGLDWDPNQVIWARGTVLSQRPWR